MVSFAKAGKYDRWEHFDTYPESSSTAFKHFRISFSVIMVLLLCNNSRNNILQPVLHQRFKGLRNNINPNISASSPQLIKDLHLLIFLHFNFLLLIATLYMSEYHQQLQIILSKSLFYLYCLFYTDFYCFISALLFSR